MPKVKQPKSSKFRNILHEYAFEFTSTCKGEIFCRFCDCLVKCDKKFMMEAHRPNASICEVHFVKLKIEKHFKTCCTRFCR